MTRNETLHYYEENQNFNWLTRYLHAVRYKRLKAIAADLNPAHGSRLRVLDIGCGPALAFHVLDGLRSDVDYVGVDIRADFCDLAARRYGAHDNFQVHRCDIAQRPDLIGGADLILALETFEHIPDRDVVRVIETIGKAEFQSLFVTVPNEIGPAVAIKNLGSAMMGYSRHREYTWKETFFAATYSLDRLPPHCDQHKGFDWRWLAQTLQKNVHIVRTYTSPVAVIPTVISPSLGFLCGKRKRP